MAAFQLVRHGRVGQRVTSRGACAVPGRSSVRLTKRPRRRSLCSPLLRPPDRPSTALCVYQAPWDGTLWAGESPSGAFDVRGIELSGAQRADRHLGATHLSALADLRGRVN